MLKVRKNIMKTTKNEIPYIDISGVNCWIAYLMPFSQEEKSNYKEIERFQNECIEKKIFGMGWNVENFLPYGKADECGRFFISDNNNYIDLFKNKDKEKSEENAEISEEDSNQEKEHPAIKAYNNYANIHPGDYVIIRLKNSHYYIGKIATNAYYLKNEDKKNLLAWRCKVEKWVEYKTQEEMASEIVGRFSQRLHRTIEIVKDYRLKLSIISAYEKKIEEKERIYNVPKVKLTRYNFVSCLTYTELEDLVYVYINSLHEKEGYKLYPSSCKVNHQKYEYTLFHQSKNPITCQVKNKDYIKAEDYENEMDKFEKIYLFSGLGFDKKTTEKYEHTKIVIINNDELFTKLGEYLQFRQLNDFYIFRPNMENSLDKLDLPSDFKQIKRWSLRKKQYKKDEQYICFSHDDFFYADEFEALINNLSDSDNENFKETIEFVKSNLKHN